MKLNDICSNERFVKGELYGSNNQIRWLTCDDDILITCHEDAKIVGKAHFCTEAILSDDWKLYEFIDGKMVEYVDPNVYHREYKEDGMHIVEDGGYVSRPTLTPEQEAKILGFRGSIYPSAAQVSGGANVMVGKEACENIKTAIPNAAAYGHACADLKSNPSEIPNSSKKEINKLQMKLDLANRHIEFLINDIERIMATDNYYLGGAHKEAQDNYYKCIDLIERGYHE